MNRDEKAAQIEEIGEDLSSATAVFAVDYRGISVPQAAELRTRLREADASFSVVKNRLAMRATERAGAGALDEHLVGPTALTFVRGDAVLAAKAISEFMRRERVLAYKGGLMEGAAIDPDQFSSIARLPGVDVLRGQLVGVAAGPLTGLVRTLNGLVAGLASQLGQLADEGLIGGDETAAEPEAAAPGGEQGDPGAGDPAGPEEPAVDAEPPAEPAAPSETAAEDSESDDETPERADAGGDDKED